MHDSEIAFGKRLRVLREEADLSQAALGRAMTRCGLGMRQSTIGKIEAAQRPVRVAEVIAFAGVFGVPPGVLLEDSASNSDAAATAQHKAIETALRAKIATEILKGGSDDEPEVFFVYRPYNDTGRLLYVGVTDNPVLRMRQHSASSHWFQHVADVTVEPYGTRTEALAAETEAINAEWPLWNRKSSPDGHVAGGFTPPSVQPSPQELRRRRTHTQRVLRLTAEAMRPMIDVTGTAW